MKHRTKLLAVAGLVICLAATVVAPAGAQDQPEFSDADLAQVGISEDELRAREPNASWDGLGLFSDDANRILGALAQPISVTPYGFGDDLDGAPVIDPTGALPTHFGVSQWRLPAEWTPPAQGIGDTMAFAQNAPIAPGSDIVFVWSEFADDFDFSAGLSLNEGVTLTIPGLPVWNSTFEGDTWEGANLMPTARVDGGVLTFDVFGFQPPQSFPAQNVPAFYYRSGNVMGVGIDAAALEALVAQGQQADAAAAPADESAATTSDLLYTPGSAETFTTQAESGISQIAFGLHFHYTFGGLFSPGYVVRYLPVIVQIVVFTLTTLAILSTLLATTSTSQPASTPADDAGTSTDNTDDDPRDTATDDDPAPTQTPPPTADGGGGLSSVVWILLIILGSVLLFLGWWLPRRPATTNADDTTDDEDDDHLPGLDDDEDDEPRDVATTPEEPAKRVWDDDDLMRYYRTEEEAIWELNDADRERWYELRSADVATAWTNAVATEARLQTRLESLVGTMASGLNEDIEKFGDAMGVYGNGIKHVIDESDDIRLLWTEWTREGGVKDMMWWADLADAVVGVTKLGLTLGEGTAKLVIRAAGSGDEALDVTRAVGAATDGGEAAASGPKAGSVNDIYDGADFAKFDDDIARLLGRDFDDYMTALPEAARRLGYYMDFTDAERVIVQRLIAKLQIAHRGGNPTFSPSDLAWLRRMGQNDGFWENLARAATQDIDARIYRLVSDLELGWLRNLANSPDAVRAADDIPIGLPTLPPGGTFRPPGGIDGTPTVLIPPGVNTPTVRLPGADSPTVIIPPGANNPTIRIPPPGANNPTVILPPGAQNPTLILPPPSGTIPHPGALTLPPPSMPTLPGGGAITLPPPTSVPTLTLPGGGAITLPPPTSVPTINLPAPGATLPYPGAITLPPPTSVPTVRFAPPGGTLPGSGAVTLPPPTSVPTLAPPGGAVTLPPPVSVTPGGATLPPPPSVPTMPPPSPSGIGMETVRLADGGVNPSGLTNPVTVPTTPTAPPAGPAGIGIDRAVDAGAEGGAGGSSLYVTLRDLIGGGR